MSMQNNYFSVAVNDEFLEKLLGRKLIEINTYAAVAISMRGCFCMR
ncbi:hypothetical protein XBKB1_530037 [Xenorhabdus bovienii str. kraussei Becker Underwood]|uniref:Uncharacterized protein n=1 Tax=Xenorhabdus bovienii str. kraussei Becker Underwood TaxID=1398204 RepID=A0A077PPL1_XENBV|nr:hypothetical protein XBKB1_530037 [Xenorhabdus bovienii str. kraussei Becker Underwood]